MNVFGKEKVRKLTGVPLGSNHLSYTSPVLASLELVNMTIQISHKLSKNELSVYHVADIMLGTMGWQGMGAGWYTD